MMIRVEFIIILFIACVLRDIYRDRTEKKQLYYNAGYRACAIDLVKIYNQSILKTTFADRFLEFVKSHGYVSVKEKNDGQNNS